ncbi:MAG TPA: hypothetical protein VN643_18710 [Pyrinomonadaceae bacterium]|nr:hypothetical protein [Pyrinomonadaceae bacterium]
MIYLLLFAAILVAVHYGYRAFSRSSTLKKLSWKPKNAELIKVLLNLDDEPLEELFALYRKEFGDGAARYARQTYLKWKAGAVRPNKQTFGRFLVNLPRVMSFDLKCEVLRELREAYCAQDNYELTVHTDDWKETLSPLVKEVIVKANSAELPGAVQNRLKWLADDDMEIARAILTRSETLQTLDALAMLEKEFSSIEQLLDNAGWRGKVTHTLRLPLGTITLRIKKR